jgi:hypothetical protein
VVFAEKERKQDILNENGRGKGGEVSGGNEKYKEISEK